jgi:sterol desaturase/sphingolipid hydroxylase (fatty acid hydroxylase superfamily)
VSAASPSFVSATASSLAAFVPGHGGFPALPPGWAEALVFVTIAAAECWRRPVPLAGTGTRWWTNLWLLAMTEGVTLAMTGLMPLSATAIASRSPLSGPMRAIPGLAALCLAIVILDAAAYATHVLFHHVAPLWRLHAVHHTDRALDVTTSVRHHPLEVVPETICLGLCVGIMGLTMGQFVAYATLAFIVQAIAHADVSPPRGLTRPLGLIFVTPDIHAVHHSPRPLETNANYGLVFSVWDRMFGTLRRRTEAGPVAVGLDTFRDARFQRLAGALTQPLARPDPPIIR